MNVLFVNACIRKEDSRTKIIASKILERFKGEVVELDLEKTNILPLNSERLKQREKLLSNGKFNDPIFEYAQQFAQADTIIIATPFWDLGFPALLKTYFENVTVGGITFRYKSGVPVGLCKAKKLVYITTSGGQIVQDFGYTYVKALATKFYGIEDVVCYRVENLDRNNVLKDGVLDEEIITIE